jgi:hypothetical protein
VRTGEITVEGCKYRPLANLKVTFYKFFNGDIEVKKVFAIDEFSGDSIDVTRNYYFPKNREKLEKTIYEYLGDELAKEMALAVQRGVFRHG